MSGASILRALDDPALFAPHFRGDTWRTWRVFLKALFGLGGAMTADERAAYRQHTGREEPPTQPFREAALVVGRRGGKSRVLALIAVYLATFRDYTEHLAAGEVATVAVIAADRKQARAIYRYALGLLQAVDLLAPLLVRFKDDEIVLSNRVQIEIHTASFRVTRGYTFAAVLADETAFWRDEESRNPDVEIFRALRPGLSTIPGAMLLNASSPYRKAGLLYQTFVRHWGREDGRVLVWRGTTQDMNPALDPDVVREAYEEDPEGAAAEYGAEFRTDVSDFVPRDVVRACTIPGRVEMLPERGRNYLAFVDPSGGSSDSMTLAIAHREGEQAVLDALREVRPRFSPEAVVADFAALLKSFRISRVVGDRYGGEWPRERFRAWGIGYDISERTKGDIYREILPLLNSAKVELLDVPRLGSQLCGLERRTGRGGRDSIDHGPGAHDDVANAAAGALLLVRARARLRITEEAIAKLSRPDFSRAGIW